MLMLICGLIIYKKIANSSDSRARTTFTEAVSLLQLVNARLPSFLILFPVKIKQ